MLKNSIEIELNNQINAQIWSAHLFLSMSMRLVADGYPTLAEKLNQQYVEEQKVMIQFANYVNEQGGHVILSDMVEIPHEFGGIVDIFEEALVHVMRITESIDSLANFVEQNNDRATRFFLNQFIMRQVTQECKFSNYISKIKKAEQNGTTYLIEPF